jgi:hypothetical protein
VILFYASFFAGVIVMYEGIAQISPIYVRVARTLGATDFEIFAKVIVPLTVPHMLTAHAGGAGRGLGHAGRLGTDRRAAGAGRADPERLVVLPARHHLRRHHLHRRSSRCDGPGCCARSAAAWWPGRTGWHDDGDRVRIRFQNASRRLPHGTGADAVVDGVELEIRKASSSPSSAPRAAARPR